MMLGTAAARKVPVCLVLYYGAIVIASLLFAAHLGNAMKIVADSESEVYPFDIILEDGSTRPLTGNDINNAQPGTIFNLDFYLEGRAVSLVYLPDVIETKKQRQLQPNVEAPEYGYDINVPADFMNNRFPNDFEPIFLDVMNSYNQTYNGYLLHFVEAEILGYPPTPIPTSGHVTRAFMSEMGGLNMTLDSIKFYSLTPMFAPYGYNSAFFVNDASTEQQHQVSYEQEVTNTYSVSFTQGFDFGFKESISAEVPGVFSSDTEIEMKWSFSSTETDEKSVSNTITDQTTINIPAYSAINVTCFVQMGHLTTNFDALVTLSDSSNVGWVFQDSHFFPPGQAWFWFLQNEQTLGGLLSVAYDIGSTLSPLYNATGVFNGVAGNTDTCYIFQCPYTPGITQCLGNNTSTAL